MNFSNRIILILIDTKSRFYVLFHGDIVQYEVFKLNCLDVSFTYHHVQYMRSFIKSDLVQKVLMYIARSKTTFYIIRTETISLYLVFSCSCSSLNNLGVSCAKHKLGLYCTASFVHLSRMASKIDLVSL